ncbi:MAG: VIT1/CCC1 transporter family protein [Acidobacteriota bacterium]
MKEKTDRQIEQYLANWREEMNGAELYRLMAKHEKDERLSAIYERLAAVEEGHAETFKARLQDLGISLPPFRTSWRTRLLGWLATRLGVESVLPTLSTIEKNTSSAYLSQGQTGEIAATELSHARLLRHLAVTTKGGMEGGMLAKMEGRHRAAGGNALRAAVLGASDGLLSNFGLLMGVAGASVASRSILLTGIAGLFAGGISMALGEWISVQSSRELYEKQIRTEEAEVEAAPQEEIEELVLIYESRGLDEAAARSFATSIMSDKGSAIKTLAREELGVTPGELGGSAWEAAFTSFLLFALGAFIPLSPYLFLAGTPAIVGSAVLSGLGLFFLGASITLFTGKPVLYSGLRQMLIGFAAATVTFLLGHIIGVSIT